MRDLAGYSPCDARSAHMTPEQLMNKWRARREDFARLCAAVSGVAVCDELLADMMAVTAATDDQCLSLQQAALYSGVSKRTIQRWIQDGTIKNMGRPGKPVVRRGDLPRKRDIAVEARTPASYDVDADAQALACQLTGGQNGSKAAA